MFNEQEMEEASYKVQYAKEGPDKKSIGMALERLNVLVLDAHKQLDSLDDILNPIMTPSPRQEEEVSTTKTLTRRDSTCELHAQLMDLASQMERLNRRLNHYKTNSNL